MAYDIECLTPPIGQADLAALGALLSDAVAAGAAVSFLAPLTRADAEAWWRDNLRDADGTTLLVVREGDLIVGGVQLQSAWAPNQPHRAEISKLLVRGSSQRAGIGAALMQAAERAAREAGYRLLTLDAKRGGPAERLYRRLGWTEAGVIPDFALDPDGVTWHDAVFFYKALGGRDGV